MVQSSFRISRDEKNTQMFYHGFKQILDSVGFHIMETYVHFMHTLVIFSNISMNDIEFWMASQWQKVESRTQYKWRFILIVPMTVKLLGCSRWRKKFDHSRLLHVEGQGWIRLKVLKCNTVGAQVGVEQVLPGNY